MALLVLIFASLPQMAAGFLLLGNLNGDHEVQCRFDNDRVEITLHHQVSGVSADYSKVHQHTLLENLLFRTCVVGDEVDHHFGFSRQSVLTEEVDSRVLELAALVAFEPVGESLISFDSVPFESMALDQPLDLEGGLSPPQVMRRGVMMRV